MENKKPKIFGIGMFKTGTKTLGAALTKLGFRTLSGPWWPEEMINDPWYEQSERWTEYYDVIKSQVEKYDAFEDYPWMYLYEECDHWWPESKFILTIRDPDRVAVSDINMLKRRGVRRRDLPSRPALRERYERHYSSVSKYFRGRTNLLLVNFEEGDGWRAICDFLGLSIPDEPFPHKNKGRYRFGRLWV